MPRPFGGSDDILKLHNKNASFVVPESAGFEHLNREVVCPLSVLHAGVLEGLASCLGRS